MGSLLLLSLAAALGINAVLFAIAYSYKSDKLTDISYALSFLALDIIALMHAKKLQPYTIVLFALVALWAVRIGGFLLIRVLYVGKDKRFDELRGSFVRFGKFWLGQALTAWVLMLPLTLAMHHGGTVGLLEGIGAAIFLAGLGIEAVADYQKFAFKRSPPNNGRWIASGLWKYARHPNYFGEIVVWVGVYVYCLAGLTTLQKLIGLSSPALIAALLLFLSGIPILEKSADQRWGSQPAYRRYKAASRLLLPIPRFR